MKAFRDLFKRMGVAALVYVVIFALVMIALQIIFKAMIMDTNVTLVVISDISMRLYMLVLGIVFPVAPIPPKSKTRIIPVSGHLLWSCQKSRLNLRFQRIYPFDELVCSCRFSVFLVGRIVNH
jgi:hypothetical protein